MITRHGSDVPALVAAAREGDARAIARLISLVENSGDQPAGDAELRRSSAREIAAALARCTGSAAATPAGHAGGAAVIGVTGAPGVGKSTTTNELIRVLRASGRRVGVLAVDPSSPFSGGAILGDRVRMQDHATDPGVFIRSMSSRGALGGLAAATPQAVRVLDAAGFDVVLVETVGVGQAEVDVAGLADTIVVVLAPGMGDAIQAVKAGILEIADVFVVNKADRDGADATYTDIQGMIALGERAAGAWRPQVVRTVAARGQGVDDLMTAIGKHTTWLAEHDQLRVRREARAAAEIEAIALGVLRSRIGTLRNGSALPGLAAQVVAGRTDPYRAADELLAGLARRGAA